MDDIIILGIEGTAWNFSTAIINSNGIIAESTNTYIPKNGGIHPREAAQHHANVASNVINDLFNKFYKKGYTKKDINAIAFSKGPGLGPCLRVTATIARMLALLLNIKLIGVNHCIAHIEIGIWNTKCSDPVVLYVSGANTQILTYNNFKYKILGETLDIGLGNSLDKFARSANLTHPGGPKIEKLAEKSKDYIKLPYTVKGMDLFYSGLSAAATRSLIYDSDNNISNLESVCYSYQEVAFSMIIEVVERAIANLKKKEVLLVGGVGANKRLQEMLFKMCKERKCSFYVPDNKYLGDNGSMIAYTGLLMYKNNDFLDIKTSYIDASFRPDTIDILWKENKKNISINNSDTNGAEAKIIINTNLNKKYLIKKRINKIYRIREIDDEIRFNRIKIELRMIIEARKLGVPTPIIYFADKENIVMQYIDGIELKNVINISLAEKIGKYIGILHKNNIIHGDLTTSNIIISKKQEIYFIDFSLSSFTKSIESKGVDIHVFFQTIENSYSLEICNQFIKKFKEGYCNTYNDANKILNRANEIKSRGRYL